MTSAEIAERLSTAVWEVVATQGIEGASMRAVAERAGCTTGMLTHHFPSRAALLSHARRMMFAQTTARADAAEADAADLVTAFRNVLESALPLDAVRLEEARVWLGFAAASIGDSALRLIHEGGNRNWLARVSRLLAATADSPDSVVEEAAIGVIALVEGLGSLAVLDPATYTRERLLGVLDNAATAAIARVRNN